MRISKVRQENFYAETNGYGLGSNFKITAHTVDHKVVDFNISYQVTSDPATMLLLAESLKILAETIKNVEGKK